ncbi:hypothetical protein SAMN05661080_02689 [Modestobacter sp. DSM 44400]|uniref:hypothetical protein n=1 Tax=Modestobacter sp. DSM 44400 TaxID=1550230 RepID=UPI0008990B23|nr:hypothetical protein [Modestobacter sp. DSM 44400]SDY20704.1 hypothetical protein SAMN05661080_02689 [Modestobacter sp. DSM 44400]
MMIRRSAAALFTALALVGGGAMTACADPTNATTGTPKDNAENTSGDDPGGVSQGNLPDISDPDHSSDRETGNGNP